MRALQFPRRGRAFLVTASFVVVLCLGAMGCAGYRLGPTNGLQAGEKSVRVASVENSSLEPRLAESLQSSLRRQIQQDGTFKLRTQEPSDIALSSTILRYERSAVSFDPNDLFTARDYSVSMTAHVKAVDRATGKVLLDQEVSGRTTLRAGSDLSSAERQALPLLADDLARNTIALLVDGTW